MPATQKQYRQPRHMDQPKISRMLRLIVLLSSNRIYTVDELAAELQTSQRTIYRYIDTFKEAGFAVEKVDDYKYRLVSIGNGVKDLHNIVYFSPEEAFIVNRLIDSLDPSNSLKNELKRKLSAIYDKTSIADFTDRPSSAKKVQTLVEAIRDKKVVRLVAYSSSYSGNTRDRLVEPYQMTSNYAGVWAYDLEDDKNKRFIVLRMADVEKTKDAWSNELAHHSLPMDAFRFHGDTEYHIVLRMNNLAKNLMVEEYPLTEKDIYEQDGILCEQMMVLGEATELPPHDMENEDEQYWIYDGTVRGLDGVGRFVMGLEGNIEVMEGDALIDYLKRHAAHIADTY